MKISRNAPCPCGSGRKYKACCLAAGEARARTGLAGGTAAPGAGEAKWHAVARLETVWEAEVAPLPMPVRDDPDAAPSLVMVVAAGYVVHGEVLPYRPAGAGGRARELARAVLAAERALGALPPRVEVRDEALAAALGAELGARGVAVGVGPLEALDEALDGALEHLGGSPLVARMTTPATWGETEASPEELAELHAAAAEFHREAPWDVLGGENLLAMRFPDGSEWMASVLGAAELEFGLVLYADPRDVLGVLGMDEEEDEDDPVAPAVETLMGMEGESLRVCFEPRGQVPRGIRRQVEAAGWPVAGPGAYPLLLGLNVPARRITAAHVRRATLALRAATLLCRAEDPAPATGVTVMPLVSGGLPTPWPTPEGPAPICAGGPHADPPSALFAWDAADEVRAAEAERLERLEGWLRWQGLAPAEMEDELHNARAWKDFLDLHVLPAGAVTEYDLRVFLYRFYPRQAGAPASAAGALPRSVRRLVRFLEEHEGIALPFAAAVLGELEEMEREWAEGGTPLPEMLDELSDELLPDLIVRLLVHHPVAAEEGSWSQAEGPEVNALSRELQRRWLLWHDEEVRGGITGLDELAEVLVRRQHEWETTPHPAHGGRTPAEVVRASLEESRSREAGIAGGEAGSR